LTLIIYAPSIAHFWNPSVLKRAGRVSSSCTQSSVASPDFSLLTSNSR
jgi:hypothetical protein